MTPLGWDVHVLCVGRVVGLHASSENARSTHVPIRSYSTAVAALDVDWMIELCGVRVDGDIDAVRAVPVLQSIYTQLGKVPRWTGADGYGLETQGKKVSRLAPLSLKRITTSATPQVQHVKPRRFTVYQRVPQPHSSVTHPNKLPRKKDGQHHATPPALL